MFLFLYLLLLFLFLYLLLLFLFLYLLLLFLLLYLSLLFLLLYLYGMVGVDDVCGLRGRIAPGAGTCGTRRPGAHTAGMSGVIISPNGHESS